MEISGKARAFENDVVAVMKRHAHDLNAQEAYQGLSLLLRRALGANISYLIKGGKSPDEVREIFVTVVEQLIAKHSGKQ